MVIDVPVRHLPLPRAKQHAHLASIPWTLPQEGLISVLRRRSQTLTARQCLWVGAD